jgi:hypothetical protein
MKQIKTSPESKRFFESVKRAMPAAATCTKDSSNARYANLRIGKRQGRREKAVMPSVSSYSTANASKMFPLLAPLRMPYPVLMKTIPPETTAPVD